MTARIDRLGPWATLLAGALALVLAGSPAALARDDGNWPVHGKLLGKPKDNGDPDGKKSADVSGIACADPTRFPRLCLIADDESQGAQIVILKDGELIAGSFIPLIDDAFGGKPLELDAEGVAFADGAFYVIGSHGRPRHDAGAEATAKSDARAAASRHLFRIRFALGAVDMQTGRLRGHPDIATSAGLPRLIMEQRALKPWFDQPLDENGLTIEGVAVQDDSLYVGMRGPVLPNGNAVILATPLGALFDAKSGQSVVHEVTLGEDTLGHARGIRDLVPYGANLLILAGPKTDPPHDKVRPGDYSLYSWNGVDPAAKWLRDLPSWGDATKPEALLPLDEKDAELRVLLLFDGPPEGMPTVVKLRLR